MSDLFYEDDLAAHKARVRALEERMATIDQQMAAWLAAQAAYVESEVRGEPRTKWREFGLFLRSAPGETPQVVIARKHTRVEVDGFMLQPLYLGMELDEIPYGRFVETLRLATMGVVS
jgi:hypothetical protein